MEINEFTNDSLNELLNELCEEKKQSFFLVIST